MYTIKYGYCTWLMLQQDIHKQGWSLQKEEITKKIFEMWISFFGVPGTLMSDNGGEFVNHLYTEVSQKLGIRKMMLNVSQR